jgi:predicted HicB family RNase H-like nuclease
MEQKPLNYFLKLKYPVMIQRIGREYEAWHPDFGRGTMFVRARSVQRAIRELNAFRKDIIRAYYERGIVIPEPQDLAKPTFSGQFVLRVPKALHARLVTEARANGTSLNSHLIHLLSEQNAFHHVTTVLERSFHTQTDNSMQLSRELHLEWQGGHTQATGKLPLPDTTLEAGLAKQRDSEQNSLEPLNPDDEKQLARAA